MKRTEQTKRLTTSAVMLALAMVLAMVCALIPFLNLPFGGGFTVASMLPIVVISYMYGMKWGFFSAAIYSLIQIVMDLYLGKGSTLISLFIPNSEDYMGEKTKNDNGALAGEVIDRMYPFYVQLITELTGWDSYNTFFTRYFAKLLEVREEVFGDKYMTDEIMFTVLEANVSSYGDELVGTEDVIDENSNVQLSEKTLGIYETKYGENCVFTYSVTGTKDIALDEYKEHADEATFRTYKIELDDIKEVKAVTIEIKAEGKAVIPEQKYS